VAQYCYQRAAERNTLAEKAELDKMTPAQQQAYLLVKQWPNAVPICHWQ
jgi:hypothetical protein